MSYEAMFVFSYAFLGFSGVLLRLRKANEPLRATVLEIPEVQKGPCQSQDTAAPSGKRGQNKNISI